MVNDLQHLFPVPEDRHGLQIANDFIAYCKSPARLRDLHLWSYNGEISSDRTMYITAHDRVVPMETTPEEALRFIGECMEYLLQDLPAKKIEDAELWGYNIRGVTIGTTRGEKEGIEATMGLYHANPPGYCVGLAVTYRVDFYCRKDPQE